MTAAERPGSVRQSIAMQPARLKRARELAGLSSGQAAVMLGVSRLLLEVAEGSRPADSHRDLSAAHSFRFDKAEEAADLYDVSIRWLQGAEPWVPGEVQEMLEAAKAMSPEDRDAVRELVGAIADPPPSRDDWFHRAFGDDA